MNADLSAALKKAVLFNDIDTVEGENLIRCFAPQVKHFLKNEIILLAGDNVRHIGIILHGTAHAYSELSDGRRTIMSNLKPASVFGEILVSTGNHESPVTIYAASDVSAAFIEYQKVYSVCAAACPAHRIFMQNMLKVIGDQYFLLFDRINILREKTLRARIMAYLYSIGDKNIPGTVILPFSKTMLAGYLLTNRSALSKELGKMVRDGIIAVDGRRITLTSPYGS